jgi:uncharacterized iron-regulated membrane protein
MKNQTLFNIHKYVALVVGGFIAFMGLTGAILAFRHDIDRAIHDERRVEVAAGAKVQWDAVFKSAAKAVPEGRVFTMRADPDPARAYEVYVEGDPSRRLWIDPYAGRIVTDTVEPGTPTGILFRLHTQLLSGEVVGTGIVAVIGASLLLLSITGIVLWWPRSLRDGFHVRWKGKNVALNYDLHRVWGALLAGFLAVNAVTGLMLLFSTSTGNTVNRMFGGALPSTRLPAGADQGRGFGSIDAVVAAANKAFPAGHVTRVRVAWPSGAVIVQKRVAPEEVHPNGLNRIYVNPYNLDVLHVVPAATAPPSVKLFAWAYPWHTGEYFGLAHRLGWVLLGLTPLFMFVTGVIVWLAKRRRSQRTATSSAPVRTAPEGQRQ